MLLEHYIDNKTLSWGPCSLHCRVDNVVAIKLYSSYDFKIVEEEDGFYDDGGNALKLIRS
jgi:ribosomal protein S18 acetylase RimI-like enzyme